MHAAAGTYYTRKGIYYYGLPVSADSYDVYIGWGTIQKHTVSSMQLTTFLRYCKSINACHLEAIKLPHLEALLAWVILPHAS